MDIEQLSRHFENYVQIETWITEHPYDMNRFFRSINSAFSEFSCVISYEETKQVFYLLYHKFNLEIEKEYFENKIDQRAHVVEQITDYLSSLYNKWV